MELPDDCWELVFKFLNKPHHLDTLSLVSNQFLSITNNLVSSFTISNNTHSLAYLPRLLTRFPNLRSLDLCDFEGDLHALLLQLSQSPSSLALDSLKIGISNSFPADGLRALAQKIPSLKSLTLNSDGWKEALHHSIADILLPLRCFPLLEELYILHNTAAGNPVTDTDIEALSLSLPKLRKVKLCANYLINDSLLFNLCKNCEFLEVVKVSVSDMVSEDGIARALKVRPNLTFLFHGHQNQCISSVFIASLVSLKHLTCLKLHLNVSDESLFSVARAGLPLRKFSLLHWSRSSYSYDGISFLLSRCRLIQHLDLGYNEFLEDKHIKELSKFLGNLMSISLSGCDLLSCLSFISLTMNCPLLNKINMDETCFGATANYEVSFVNFQVKSIMLINIRGFLDDNVEILAKICPNLEVLDLGGRKWMSNGAVEALKICKKIRYLSLRYHTYVNLSGMKNFQFPNLEVLKLSFSKIDDKSLLILSKSCPVLLELDMESCSEITTKGVKHVVKRCKQLRQINLTSCRGVAPSVVAWMVSSRQSLRKICAPPKFRISESLKELFLRRGCLVEV